jgi:hypothetical protein
VCWRQQALWQSLPNLYDMASIWPGFFPQRLGFWFVQPELYESMIGG